MVFTFTYDLERKGVTRSDFGDQEGEISEYVKRNITYLARDKAVEYHKAHRGDKETVIAFPNESNKIYDLHIVYEGEDEEEEEEEDEPEESDNDDNALDEMLAKFSCDAQNDDDDDNDEPGEKKNTYAPPFLFVYDMTEKDIVSAKYGGTNVSANVKEKLENVVRHHAKNKFAESHNNASNAKTGEITIFYPDPNSENYWYECQVTVTASGTGLPTVMNNEKNMLAWQRHAILAILAAE